ncbi:hypothetical protein SLEP1_g54283 [Rubroshorea leprosula]|uniref:Uncharacterized protein n=1 Tax=Rubroshorea leprosula TaxID=152421 RepID=A0AAV5MBX3_9ROSI|nr:hypothetical protein SLEP1_g54283 [Rubroshorea leprosula]
MCKSAWLVFGGPVPSSLSLPKLFPWPVTEKSKPCPPDLLPWPVQRPLLA